MGTEQQTPADRVKAKRDKRTGHCVSTRCGAKCEVFAYDRREDGFDICVCGHTQWAHEPEEASA